MSAVNWLQRARDFLEKRPDPTDETDKTPLSSVSSVPPPAVSEKRESANDAQAATPDLPPKLAQSCATCTHCTQARTCAEPEAAGLADRFRVVWLDLIGNHGRTCTAWSERDQRQPVEMVPRLTPEQQRAVIGLDDAELQRLSRYMRRAQRYGLDLDVCERIADLLTLRDRQHDDRRMCLECSHLEPSGRCAAARSGRLAGAGRDLHPVKVVLMRCPGFTTNARD